MTFAVRFHRPEARSRNSEQTDLDRHQAWLGSSTNVTAAAMASLAPAPEGMHRAVVPGVEFPLPSLLPESR